MRYAVIGAGGIGSGIAGFMDQAGLEAVMVARPAHAAAVRESGLELILKDSTTDITHPTAVSAVDEVDWASVDVGLLTTKSYDTVSVAESLIRLGRPIPPIVCVQNGVENEPTLARFGLFPVAAMARFKARLVEPGRVYVPGERSITLGAWGEYKEPDLLEGIREDLVAVGISSSISDRILTVKWSKLIANCVNVIYAITGSQISDIRTDAHLARSINLVWEEARNVLAHSGIEFDPVPDLEIPRGDSPASPGKQSDELEYHGSTWDDISRNKTRNEVPWFNGEIVRVAAEHGIGAPLNRYLLSMSGVLTGPERADIPENTARLEAKLLALSD